MDDIVQRTFNQFRPLQHYKKLTDHELMDIVVEKAKARDKDLDVGGMFSDRAEKFQAKSLLKKYLDDYSIQTISDKNDLKNIIYSEIIHKRLQNKLNTFADKDSVPIALLKALQENTESISKQKEKLGIHRKQTGSKDVLFKLGRKFKIWLRENQLHRTCICPHCSKIILFRLRMEKYEALKHPFFRDRIFTNKVLLDSLNKTIKITKKFIGDVLGTSEDYINWIVNKYKPEENNEVPKNHKT